jgi:hypothetical protein
MRHLKLLFISIVVLTLVVTFLFALFPSHMRISRVINIGVSAQKASSLVGELASWENWNQLVKTGVQQKQYLSTPSYGKGAFLKENGTQITLVFVGTDSVTALWQQASGTPLKSGFNFIQVNKGYTTVEWYFDFYFRWYPWQKLGSMFYDKQIGPLMEKSLADLKTYAENH